MILPGELNAAVGRFLEGQGGLAASSAALTGAYRAGASSSAVDARAYLAARLPATYGACERVLGEAAKAAPDFAPKSLLDVGTGPGTAAWAAVSRWPGIASVTQVEQDASFAALAGQLNSQSAVAALVAARMIHKPLAAVDESLTAELVMASYMLAELPESATAEAVLRLWSMAGTMLVLIEPGTPRGFARIRLARSQLLKSGALVAAPCTHGDACPISGDDWCHFKVRVQRSRLHMHAKRASLPFEDEPISYLVATRTPVTRNAGRIVAPPHASKAGVSLAVCSHAGIAQLVIASRNREQYKKAKKAQWGDAWPPEDS